MEAYALKMTLGVDQKTAEGLVQGYLDGFPGLKKWRENSRIQVRKNGVIKNFVGRVRHLNKVTKVEKAWGTDNKGVCNVMNWRLRNDRTDYLLTEINEEMWDKISIDNTINYELYDNELKEPKDLKRQLKRFAKLEKEFTDDDRQQVYLDDYLTRVKELAKTTVMRDYRDYRNGLNNCLNFQLQSLAAAVVNRAALQINKKARELGYDAIVQAQVHDQLIINVADDQAEEFSKIVQEVMETTTQLPGVTLKAPPEIANNWRDGH